MKPQPFKVGDTVRFRIDHPWYHPPYPITSSYFDEEADEYFEEDTGDVEECAHPLCNMVALSVWKVSDIVYDEYDENWRVYLHGDTDKDYPVWEHVLELIEKHKRASGFGKFIKEIEGVI